MTFPFLKPVVAPLKVLADALVQTGTAANVLEAGRIRAEVQETEAIVVAYWEGILEETRWELAEQRRTAVAAGGAAAGEALEAEGGTGPAKKKSKATKRKQQKRMAQQQKKVVEAAEAAAATAETRGKEVTEGQGQQEGQKQEQEQGKEQDEKQEVQDEGGIRNSWRPQRLSWQLWL